MAEGDALCMNQFKAELMKKSIDCVNDTFKIALYTARLANPDGNPVYAVLNEIVAANYVAGGATVATPAVTQDDAGNLGKWDDDGSNVSWANLGAADMSNGAARLYDNTTATKWVLIQWELATSSNGGNYGLTFGAGGIMTIS